MPTTTKMKVIKHAILRVTAEVSTFFSFLGQISALTIFGIRHYVTFHLIDLTNFKLVSNLGINESFFKLGTRNFAWKSDKH